MCSVFLAHEPLFQGSKAGAEQGILGSQLG
jgi:hypothetical protein